MIVLLSLVVVILLLLMLLIVAVRYNLKLQKEIAQYRWMNNHLSNQFSDFYKKN